MNKNLDIIFLIPSYNRYDGLISVINAIIEQSKHLNFKIIVVNDCSNDNRYDTLTSTYDNIIYHKNETNNGKDGYYITVNKLLEIANNNKANKYIFLADDSLPSKNLINIVNKYLDNGAKVINIAIHQKELIKNWGLNNWVDGGLAITHDTYVKINQKLENVVRVGYGTGVYREITLRLNKHNIRIHFPKYSLLYHMGHTDSVMHPSIRVKEKIFSYSFVDNMDTTDVFREETINLINQKIQLKISDAVIFFKDKMMEKYGTIEYTNNNAPAIFFGMYNQKDYSSFIRHSGQKIIIWCGTDALKLKNNPNWWGELGKAVNIAMSSFIKDSLKQCNIESEIIPITPTKSYLNVKPKGDSIYWYYNSDGKRNFYGGKIVNQIKQLTNYKIIEANGNSYNDEQLNKVYEDCFLGLRLTEHDGLSNTVVEMGLMGRYCIHNGDTPNSIKYDPNNITDIINKINEQYNNKNTTDNILAKQVYDYMSVGDNINKLFFAYDAVVDNNKIEIVNKNNINKANQLKNNIKKKTGGTSNGSIGNNEMNPQSVTPEPKIIPIVNNDITTKRQKLYTPEQNQPTRPSINKIPNDLMMGKIRKSNLKFGRR